MDRPRERLRALGGERISDRDLLAVLIGTGTRGRPVETIASQVLERIGGLPALARASPGELKASGVGATRALQISAAFHLARRAIEVSRHADEWWTYEDLWQRLRVRAAGLSQEVFWVISLDVKGRIIEDCEVARGTLDQVDVHPRDVFRPLVRVAANMGIIAHNHPSGDARASADDVELTRRLRECGDLIGIPIVDHLVIGDEGWTSVLEQEEQI